MSETTHREIVLDNKVYGTDGGSGSITAGDIPYGDGTVEGALDDVKDDITELNSNIIIQDITSQITTTTAMTGGSLKVLKYGKLVQVVGAGVNSDLGQSITIATGFPKPRGYAHTIVEKFGTIYGAAYIDYNDNKLDLHHTTAGDVWFSMLYLTND